jgi:hypothetical protein
MKIPTADQLIVYILETTLAIHALTAADLPAAVGSLEYKLKGDVTLYAAMYGIADLAPYWSSIAEQCTMLYDMRAQPPDCDQINPAQKLDELRAKLRKRSE